MSEEGGTRIQRRPQVEQIPQQMPPPQMQMQQQMHPQMAMQQHPQMGLQQQMAMQQQQSHQVSPHVKVPSGTSFFSMPSIDSQNMKNALIVVVLFVIFNSKMVWKEIIRLPFMGGIEPSIVALIFNALLAGIVFYIIKEMI